MYFLNFKNNNVSYPLTLYGKLNYLTELFERNYLKLLEYIEKGNWVAPNQNVLVQFLVNMDVSLDWDDEYIYNYIGTKYKTVASTLGITSVFKKGKDHIKSVFPENDHHSHIFIPFGNSEYSFNEYFYELPYETLLPLKPIFTTDTKQRWNTNDLTSNVVTSGSNYTIIQLDPYALVIGYVRYCRERIKEDKLVGLTPHSYIMRYPLANFYYLHNLLVSMNYCLEGLSGYEIKEGKWNLVNYDRWIKEYALYIKYSMSKFNPRSIYHFININSTLNDNILNKSIYPFMGMSESFPHLGLLYTFNAMNISIHYDRYCKYVGKTDGSFLTMVKKFLRNDIKYLSGNITDPIWNKLFIDMFKDLKKQIES